MTTLTLVLRNLRFHARSHLGTLLGAGIGTAVLVGALVVGDSVRGSLRDMALARLGKTEVALASNDRFFRAELANEIGKELGCAAAGAIQVQGTAALSDGSARANRVQVLGVDENFWKLSLEPGPVQALAAEEVVLNQPLADQLKAKAGDVILLRVPKPSQLSREAPISPQEDFAQALRVTVRGVVADKEMGRFSLQANQVAPFTAFASSSWLGERLQITNRANLLLVSQGAGISVPNATSALRNHFQLPDAELELRAIPQGGGLELRTGRIFFDPATATAAFGVSTNAAGVLTYFVNELRIGDRATPYSMVTAVGEPVVPREMRDDEILVNSWLAEDLAAKPGDRISISYFTIGTSRRLEERTNSFTLRAVLPLEGAAADRTLMPDFPGLDKAESTRDWDSSLPIKLEKIRPKDEEYWKQYRGTPKAFVTLAAGQQMWTNRFGNLTAIRYPATTSTPELSQALLRSLDPGSIGLTFQPVRQEALLASGQAQDFGQLFLGFSFFLIVAALLLMALLFQFGIERRAPEVGTFLALGFTPRQVRRLLLGEGAALAVLGGLLGVLGGIGYARCMLYGLATLWRTAVGTSSLAYHANPATLAIGALSGVVIALLTIWLALRHQAKQPARELLAEGMEFDRSRSRTQPRSRGIWVGWVASALAMLLLGWAGLEKQTSNPEMFFCAGTLLLISGIGFTSAFLTALGSAETTNGPTLANLGLRNAARRRRRSLAAIGLLACGSFLVASIGVFKLDSDADEQRRSSGTGGFALIGESTLPIVHDLNSEEGRQFFGLSSNDLPEVRFVPMRVRDGEDASCLNLNRAQRPRVLGVRADLLGQRHAFTFAKVDKGFEDGNPWSLLNRHLPDGTAPAVGDAASIQWALGKKVGDTLPYTDDRGREFGIRLAGAVANSILQGNLIMGENEFLTRFPLEDGYRLFLIDVPSRQSAQIETIAATLSRAMQDYGMQVTRTTERLAAFNAVQNTYLNTFQVLGGLGLLLGSVGLGVIVLRNVLERRGEFAVLLAVGFRPRSLKWLVLSEHGALLVLGLLLGIAAAFVAVLPAVFAPGATVPFRSLAFTLGGILISGGVWTWLATLLAMRGNLLDALRNE